MEPLRPRPPILDITRDGAFRRPVATPGTWLDRALARVGGVALLLAVAAAGLVVAALAFALIGLLLPVLLGAAAIGVGALWWRARRARTDPTRFGAHRRP